MPLVLHYCSYFLTLILMTLMIMSSSSINNPVGILIESVIPIYYLEQMYHLSI